MRILAQVYPNGEARFRVITTPPDKEKACDRDSTLTLAANSIRPIKRSRRKIEVDGKTYYPGFGMTPHKTSFGLRAKRTILRVGGVMDGLPGWNTCITLTLPADNMRAFHTLADYSSYAIDRFKTWIRNVPLKGEEFLYFYVWELQKRGALHIHLCVNAPTLKALNSLKQGSKDAWIRTLQLIEKDSGCNLFLGKNNRDWRYYPEKIQVDVQVVRKSVSAYFAKYCGKDKNSAIHHIDRGLRPVRWWGCSREILRRMREQTGTWLTPVLHPGQALSVLSGLYRKSQVLASKSYVFRERYRSFLQCISYVPKYDFLLLKSQIDEVFNELKVCKYMSDDYIPGYMAAKTGMKNWWDTSNRRWILYNALALPEEDWTLLSMWQSNERAVDQEFIVELWERFVAARASEFYQHPGPAQGNLFLDDFW